jgi:hypothetical protein
MLLVSPDPALTTYNETTPVLFKSVVPEGFAAIRLMATGEQVSAVWYPTGRGYSVPSLNIPGYKSGDDTKITVKFSKSFTGTRANVYITPRKDGPTEVKVRFHNLKEPPTGKRYVLWAVSADNQFTNLSELVTMNVGQIVRRPVRIDIELKGQTTLSDFGLLLTMENSSLPLEGPAGPPVATFHIGP